MTFSEGGSFVRARRGSGIGGGAIETMTAGEGETSSLAYPPDYARYLIDVTVSLLKSLQPELAKLGMISLPWSELELAHFVSSVFRHSKVSYSVLLTGLLYLLRFRYSFNQKPRHNTTTIVSSCNTLLVIFVTSLVLSSKFLHDRHTSNQSWSAYTGIPSAELNRGEIFFLSTIQHQLNVDQGAFQKWISILFQPQNLLPYQIMPPDNQVPRTPPPPFREQQGMSYMSMTTARPFIDSYKQRPEQTFMGYLPGY